MNVQSLGEQERIATELTAEQRDLRDAVRQFVRAEISPIAGQTDEDGTFPEDTFRQMAALGFLGIPIPEAHGGVGADLLSYNLALEEISSACASTALRRAR